MTVLRNYFFLGILIGKLLLPTEATAQVNGGPAAAIAGAEYILVREFKAAEVEPTGKPNEYHLTLLALNRDGEPDQEVVGGILFEVNGKPTIVPFEQGGVGDLVVLDSTRAHEVRLRAVDSNVAHVISLPRAYGWLLWALGGLLVGGGGVLLWMRRRRKAG